MKKVIKAVLFLVAMLSLGNLFAHAIDKPGWLLPIATTLFVFALIKKASGQKFGSFAFELDPSDISFHGEEVRTFRDAVYDLVYPKPKLTDYATVIQDIVALKQIAILGLFGLSGRTHDISNCAPVDNGQPQVNRQKFWTPNTISDRFSLCWTDLMNQFYVWAEQSGIKRPDLEPTDIWTFLEMRVADSMTAASFRHAWFGDTAAATIENGGNITNGTDITFFNAIDGFWKQLYAIGIADATKQIAIANNSGGSYAAQKFSAGDVTAEVITNVLQDMSDAMDPRFEEVEDKAWYVTKSVRDQFRRERLKNYPAIDQAYERREEGFSEKAWTGYQFNGIPMIVVPEWDRLIKAYENNGTKCYNPHRIALLSKQNTQLGFDTMTTTGMPNNGLWETFYMPTDKKTYLDYMFRMDAKIILDYAVVIGS